MHDYATENGLTNWDEARNRWVSTKEVGAYLGKSRAWITQQIRRDEHPLPHRKTTGGYLYRLDEIDRWLDQEAERDEVQLAAARRRRLRRSHAEARAAQ